MSGFHRFLNHSAPPTSREAMKTLQKSDLMTAGYVYFHARNMDPELSPTDLLIHVETDAYVCTESGQLLFVTIRRHIYPVGVAKANEPTEVW